jgi:hypothetical protein
VADRRDHQQQAECVSDETRHADQYAADQHDQAVEQLPRRHLSPLQPVPGVREHAETDPPYDERPERAYDDEDQQSPQQTDLPCHQDECHDLGSNEKKERDQEHIAG